MITRQVLQLDVCAAEVRLYNMPATDLWPLVLLYMLSRHAQLPPFSCSTIKALHQPCMGFWSYRDLALELRLS